MIEIFKLTSLPIKQRAMKVLRILEASENALVQNRGDEFLDPFYLCALLKTIKDDIFENISKEVIEWINNPDEKTKRRIINITRYELYNRLNISPSEWDLILPDSLPEDIKRFKRKFFKNIYVYAEDIRTPFNIGSIFRTAESFGVEKVFLSPNCVSPSSHKAKRTAMGCTEYLPHERISLDSLPKLPIIVLETGGKNISSFEFHKEGIVIIGSEELGVSPEAIEKASDNIVSIPMYGIKASLNVSVAFGILMQKWSEVFASIPS